MQPILNVFRLWLAVAIAVFRRIFKRLLLGPTVPSWTWRTEIVIATARAVITFAAKVPDDPIINQVGLRVRAPVPPSLRGKVRVSRSRLGSLDADRYVRLSAASDSATLLYFHGGGYVYGNPGIHRQHIARLVDATGSTAYAPRYRLAPEHKFPAALEDAVAAYRSLTETGLSPSEIIVSGDSAGGGLALALLLALRDAEDELPSGAILFSPYTDLEHTSYTIATNAETDYLPIEELVRPSPYYAAAEDLRNPLVSPVQADLTGLPRMLIFAGGREMMLDDSVRLKANADRDGVDADLVIEPDMMHVWPAIVPWEPASIRSLKVAADWIASAM